MIQWKRLLSLCVVAIVILPGRPADAFWKRIGKMSGPGHYYGLELLFPYRLSPTLTIRSHNRNVHVLRLFGVDTVKLEKTCDGLISELAYRELLDRELPVKLPDHSNLPTGELPTGELPTGVGCTDPTADIKVFLKDFIQLQLFPGEPVSAIQGGPASAQEAALADEVQKKMKLVNDIVVERLSEQFKRNTRPSAGPGVFAGFRAMQPAGELIKNRFFTLSLGFAFAAENTIYGDVFTGEKDVVWLSVFPAIEQRFMKFEFIKIDANLFAQVGPAVHYFLGAQFDDFLKVSIRGRFGVQWGKFYLGGEVDYFFSAIRKDDFGAVPDPTDLDRWTYGGFVGIDLTSGR